jgi:hypothetical protein
MGAVPCGYVALRWIVRPALFGANSKGKYPGKQSDGTAISGTEKMKNTQHNDISPLR